MSAFTVNQNGQLDLSQWDDSFFAELFQVQEPAEYDHLLTALKRKNYPGIYAHLKKLEKPLTAAQAIEACTLALNCTANVFDRLLDHCPALSRFDFSVVNEVIQRDKYQMLDILLRRGMSPNRKRKGCSTPLELVMRHSALLCLERLLKEKKLRCTLTEPILQQWACLDEEDDSSLTHTWCCQALAARVLKNDSPCPFGPTPIPEQLTFSHAAAVRNCSLLSRLCRERTLTDDDVAAIFTCFDLVDPHEFQHRASLDKQVELLDTLLQVRPGLLNQSRTRFLLVRDALWQEEVPERLKPWLAKLRRGQVRIQDRSLFFSDFPGSNDQTRLIFRRWKARFGDRLTPAVNRNDAWLLWWSTVPQLQIYLEYCTVTGKAPAHGLSPLAKEVIDQLETMPVRLLERQFQPGGVFAGESQTEILAACGELPLQMRKNLLPYLSKKVDYTL